MTFLASMTCWRRSILRQIYQNSFIDSNWRLLHCSISSAPIWIPCSSLGRNGIQTNGHLSELRKHSVRVFQRSSLKKRARLATQHRSGFRTFIFQLEHWSIRRVSVGLRKIARCLHTGWCARKSRRNTTIQRDSPANVRLLE